MKKAMMLMVLGIAVQAIAAVTVTNITCRQHYPWNGLVDIDYDIVSDDASAKYWVYPKGEDKRLGKTIKMVTLSGDGATNYVGVGHHRMVWDAKTDMPKFMTTDLQVTLQVIANAGPYLVVDVSGGPDALFYPMRYSAVGPDLSDDKCRTDEIWLRFIPSGSFMMGSPTNEWGRSDDETLHKVILTKPYYMCIFEVTEKQWYNVMGGTVPSTWHGADCKPIIGVNWSNIRGSYNWPSSHAVKNGTFMDRIRKRTQLTWDLPTEAQWEYACRAGTTTSLNTGKDVTADTCEAMDEAGRYNGNQNVQILFETGLAPVGYYQPNNWGLYDMHGNVSEFCLDNYDANSYAPRASEDVETCVDPVGWPGSGGGIVRGGTRSDTAKDCRSACRRSYYGWSYHGFRPVVLPFD